MKYKPLIAGLLLSLIPVLLAFIIVVNSDRFAQTDTAKIAVTANEAQKLIESGDAQAALNKLELVQTQVQSIDPDSKSDKYIWIICASAAVVINIAFVYIWLSIIRPFHSLEKYADDIASGNFSESLEYGRNNYFGKFTWAFDSMRREIVKARAREREAIENNKTVIATLSHDLKTPVASITAYSEALVNGLYSDTEEMYSYLDVINSKCGEVIKLTNDMITHSINELNGLKMEPESFDLCELVQSTISQFPTGFQAEFEKPMFAARVCADKGRLAQLIENILANAAKYAKTKVSISIVKKGGFFSLIFRDYGKGIPDEDMPFVLDKFYRGSNTADENGSGLGLYIVKYIAEQSGGEVRIENCDPGLKVTVVIPEDNKEIIVQ